MRHRALLDRLDARLGDGDHGENMSVGFGDAVRAMRAGSPTGGTPASCSATSASWSSRAWAARAARCTARAFIEAGIAVVGRAALDVGDLATALDAAAEGLARRGRCRQGDKTIYDALRPGGGRGRRGRRAGGPMAWTPRSAAAAAAARAGMIATRPLVARRGLALRLGERSRGHQDPGATSCFLLVRAMLPAAGRA